MGAMAKAASAEEGSNGGDAGGSVGVCAQPRISTRPEGRAAARLLGGRQEAETLLWRPAGKAANAPPVPAALPGRKMRHSKLKRQQHSNGREDEMKLDDKQDLLAQVGEGHGYMNKLP